MGDCCGGAREVLTSRSTWDANPIGGFLVGGFPGWAPTIGTVETSVAAVGEEPCCDACASKVSVAVEVEAGGCETGLCGVPMSAGIPMRLDGAGGVSAGALPERRVRLVDVPEGVNDYAAAWARATGVRPRSAGVIGSSVMSVDRVPFRRSNLTDIRAMTVSELEARRDALFGAPMGTEVDAETMAVEQELDRRAFGGDAGGGGGGGGGGEDDTPETLTAAEWEEKREAIAEATANRLEPGDDPASRARRDAIIRQAVTGTFATFNNYLDREYDTRVTQIRGDVSITLQRLRNENAAADREYRLALANRNGGLFNSGGGGGGVATIGVLGLLAALAAKAF